MRDLNKKLQKFLKEKQTKPTKASTNPKGSLTPHVTYEITSPTTATSHKKANSRQFSMT